MLHRKAGHKCQTTPPRQSPSDAELRSDFIKPYQYGFKCGREWVETASNEAFREALQRETVKEQIRRYLDMFAAYDESISGHDDLTSEVWKGGFTITPPHEDHHCHEEISEFFLLIVDKYPCLQGYTDPNSDPELWCKNLYLRDIPTVAFRRMEEGWSDGVKW